MKILLIIPSLRNGGAERVTANLSKSFEQRGHDVLVVTFSKGHVDYPVTNHLELGLEASTNLIKRTYNVILRSYRIKKIKMSYQPNVSISLLFGANLVNVITKQKHELVITSIRSPIKYEAKKFIKKFLNSIIYRYSDIVVPVSKGIKQELLKNHKVSENKVYVISNYINTANNLLPKKDLQNIPTLITIGRLEAVKAQWHMIYAVHDLINRHNNIRLNILGHGSLLEPLKKLIKDLSLESHVYILGFQKDIHQFLKDSDIFCFSSKHEGFGNVLIEAMNMGLPIISTDVPHGPKEILNPFEIDLYKNDEIILDVKYGLLVEYGNNPLSNQFGYYDAYIVKQFVEKISLLIDDSSLFNHYSKQSLNRVKDFSEDKIIKYWISLLEQTQDESN